jgi:hypothetical protein
MPGRVRRRSGAAPRCPFLVHLCPSFAVPVPRTIRYAVRKTLRGNLAASSCQAEVCSGRIGCPILLCGPRAGRPAPCWPQRRRRSASALIIGFRHQAQLWLGSPGRLDGRRLGRELQAGLAQQGPDLVPQPLPHLDMCQISCHHLYEAKRPSLAPDVCRLPAGRAAVPRRPSSQGEPKPLAAAQAFTGPFHHDE